MDFENKMKDVMFLVEKINPQNFKVDVDYESLDFMDEKSIVNEIMTNYLNDKKCVYETFINIKNLDNVSLNVRKAFFLNFLTQQQEIKCHNKYLTTLDELKEYLFFIHENSRYNPDDYTAKMKRLFGKNLVTEVVTYVKESQINS